MDGGQIEREREWESGWNIIKMSENGNYKSIGMKMDSLATTIPGNEY